MATPVCCCAVLSRYIFAQRTAGASRHPAFPAPSWTRGWNDQAKLGRNALRERELMSAVERSVASFPGIRRTALALRGHLRRPCGGPSPSSLPVLPSASPAPPMANCVELRGRGGYEPEIERKFASEGFTVFAGRRDGAKLEPLVKEIEQAGGEIHARALDARKEDQIISFLGDSDKHAPLEVCIFNVGANVNFPILDTTERVFRKVWEMACYSGFLAGREAARLMLPRGQDNIFFTPCDGELRGGSGYAAFASAKFGLRAVAQAAARELRPKNIHVAHLIIDSGVDTEWVR